MNEDLTLWRLLKLLPGVKPRIAAKCFTEAEPLENGSYMICGKHLTAEQYNSIFYTWFSSTWMTDLYFVKGAGTDILLDMYNEELLPMQKGKHPTPDIAEFLMAANSIKAKEARSRAYHERLEHIKEHPEDITEQDLNIYLDELWKIHSEVKKVETNEKDDVLTTKIIGKFEVTECSGCHDSKNPRKPLQYFKRYSWIGENGKPTYRENAIF